MPIDLTGARVLVVGASGGIGGAAAEAFAAAGADVARPSRAELDIADDSSIEAYLAGVGAGAAAFDHVVVAAAQTRTGPVAGLPLADAHASMNSKFFGAYRVARAARITGGGSITSVSGFLSQRPSASSVLQGAINAALEALVRGLALERAPVRVNTVSPGLIDTPLYAKMDEAARQATFEKAAGRLPARHSGACVVGRRSSAGCDVCGPICGCHGRPGAFSNACNIKQ